MARVPISGMDLCSEQGVNARGRQVQVEEDGAKSSAHSHCRGTGKFERSRSGERRHAQKMGRGVAAVVTVKITVERRTLGTIITSPHRRRTGAGSGCRHGPSATHAGQQNHQREYRGHVTLQRHTVNIA